MRQKNKGIILVALIFFAASLFLLSISNIAYALTESNITVEVDILTFTEITVTPTFLNWSTLLPGTTGGPKTVDIQNTGSTNVTSLFSYISTVENETSSPYTQSIAGLYSAGGVVVLRNQSYSMFYWAGRLEWNWTESIANTDKTSSGIDARSRVAEGFIRNTTNSYYWLAGNGTDGKCNETGAMFSLDDQPDNGTTTTRTPDSTSIARNGGDESFGYFSVSRAGSPLNRMCVAVSQDCGKIYIYKFTANYRGLNGTLCNNFQYVNANQIQPSEIEKVTADVYIPKGIPAGTMKTAKWTFAATGV